MEVMDEPAPSDSVMSCHGPYLRLAGFDVATNTLRVSVLVIAPLEGGAAPQLSAHWRDEGSNAASRMTAGITLDTFAGCAFIRFDLSTVCGAAERRVQYAVAEQGAEPEFTARQAFTVAAAGAPWRWAFFSCNGFHSEADREAFGDIQHLWSDVMAQHSSKPLHAMVGGGDQLYNDHVWEVPTLAEWLSLPDAQERVLMDPDLALIDEVEEFYFQHYLTHWSEPVFSDALASIPAAMCWDDHDIFDGWGSYPADINTSPVFKAVFAAARRFYALFQLHTTVARAQQDGYTAGAPGTFGTLVNMGPGVAVLLPDTRSERTTYQIMSPAAHAAIKTVLDTSLHPSVKHLIFLAPVPMIYPEIPLAMEGLKAITENRYSEVNQWIQKTGLMASIVSQFGTAELYDDMLDHWSCKPHAAEKVAVLKMLQHVSASKGIRTSIMAGDVHLACVGHFYSASARDPASDPRNMVQIVSSAIGNTPPPAGVVKLLTASATISSAEPDTMQCLDKVLGEDLLVPQRNWCLVELDTSCQLLFKLLMVTSHGEGPVKAHEVKVPALKNGEAGSSGTCAGPGTGTGTGTSKGSVTSKGSIAPVVPANGRAWWKIC